MGGIKICVKDNEEKNRINTVKQPYDVFFKDMFDFKPQATTNLVYRGIIYKESENQEKINEIGARLLIDRLFESTDFMVILEFQKKVPTFDDKIRFGGYQMAVIKETYKKTMVIVIELELKEGYNENFGFSPEYNMLIHHVSLLEYDCEENLNSIRNKVEFNDDDIVTLLTVPLMEEDKKKRKEIIFETAEIADCIENLSKSDLYHIKRLQYILGEAELDAEDFEKFRRLLGMDYIEQERELLRPLFEDYVEKERKEADRKVEEADRKVEEAKRGMEEAAKYLLKEGIPVEKVIKATKLDKNKILAINALIK